MGENQILIYVWMGCKFPPSHPHPLFLTDLVSVSLTLPRVQNQPGFAVCSDQIGSRVVIPFEILGCSPTRRCGHELLRRRCPSPHYMLKVIWGAPNVSSSSAAHPKGLSGPTRTNTLSDVLSSSPLYRRRCGGTRRFADTLRASRARLVSRTI
jgi:hypothetical protein